MGDALAALLDTTNTLRRTIQPLPVNAVKRETAKEKKNVNTSKPSGLGNCDSQHSIREGGGLHKLWKTVRTH